MTGHPAQNVRSSGTLLAAIAEANRGAEAFRTRVLPLIDEEAFRDCFSADNGRPNGTSIARVTSRTRSGSRLSGAYRWWRGTSTRSYRLSRLRLATALEERDLCMRRSRRFWHAQPADADKGVAAGIVKGHLADRYGPLRTIGIGTSENDVPMLLAVDESFVVARADGTHAPAAAAVVRPDQLVHERGPAGFSRAVLDALGRLGGP